MARPSPRSARAFDQAVQVHRAALDRILDKRSLPGLQKFYEGAQAELARKLNRLIRTGRKDTMTALQLRQLLEQVKIAQKDIAAQLAAGLKPAAREAQAEGVRLGYYEEGARFYLGANSEARLCYYAERTKRISQARRQAGARAGAGRRAGEPGGQAVG